MTPPEKTDHPMILYVEHVETTPDFQLNSRDRVTSIDLELPSEIAEILAIYFMHRNQDTQKTGVRIRLSGRLVLS